jgi:hypothetical protein
MPSADPPFTAHFLIVSRQNKTSFPRTIDIIAAQSCDQSSSRTREKNHRL